MNSLIYHRVMRLLADRQRRAVESVEPYAVGSSVGSVRSKNEDVGAIVRVRYPDSPDRNYDLAIVCDGMGGMADGRRAALVAASRFIAEILSAPRFSIPYEKLKKALNAAQREVSDELRGEGGTTLSAIYIDSSPLSWVAHVGDSRAYGINSGGNVEQLTRDDTLGVALNRENERRADFSRLIQFVGIDGDLEPQIGSVYSKDYRGFLLTSDGAHNAPSDVLSTVCQHARSGPELIRRLLSLSDALGGLDNATALYMPSSLQSEQISGIPEELLISILSPSGDRDIWVTQSESSITPWRVEENGAASGSHGESSTREAASEVKAVKRKRSTRRRPKPSELPLEEPTPIAKLDFSEHDHGEDNS